MEAHKEVAGCWEEYEKKGGGALINHASFAEVLNKGKREVGKTVWIDSDTEEVLRNLGSLKKCLEGRGDALSSCFSVLNLLNSWA